MDTRDEIDSDREIATRFDTFSELARRRSEGHSVLLPRHLTGNDRRMHVRQTLREDHQDRIRFGLPDAQQKFDKLAGSLFSFFRGTCLLFYRDMAGEDAWMPTVLTLGDVHPENFGVMPSSDNTPLFGVNDFDEAYYAPFTWDLKRGVVGFTIAARAEGMSEKVQRKTIKHFVKGYLERMEDFARGEDELSHQLRLDSAKGVVLDLLEDAQIDRAEWLEEHIDPKRRRFVAGEEVVPMRSELDALRDRVQAYRDDLDDPPARAGDFEVLDVARKRGSGTASLGLPRYWFLIAGPSDDGTDDLILEMKRARRSALAGLAPPSQLQEDGEADRVIRAEAVQLVGGDPFYGAVEIDGESFLVRERSPFKNEVDVEDLSKKEWREYARHCGRTLAHAHALSDESGSIDGDLEPRILEAAGPPKLLVKDLTRFAYEAADRLERDHEAFIEDHHRGAFDSIDLIYV